MANEEIILENYVNLLEKSINQDINPKENFIKFASGKFSLDNYNQKYGEYPPNHFGDPYVKILENENLNYPSIVKARNFYKSYETDIKKILQNEEIIDFCGGFPIFNNNWNEVDFDWIKASAILSAMYLHTIISYSIKYDDDNKRVIKASCKILDSDLISSANEILVKYEIDGDKISEIIKDVTTVKDELLSQAPYATEKELKEQFFNRFFEFSTGVILTDEDTLEYDSYDSSYIQGLLNIFSGLSPKCIANYITFVAITENEEDRITSIPEQLLELYFAPAIYAAGYSKYWSPREEEIHKELNECFLKYYEMNKDKFTLDDLKTTSAFMIDTEKMCEIISTHFSQDEVDQEYYDLEMDPSNFVGNIMKLIKFETPKSLKIHFSQKYENDFSLCYLIGFLQNIVNTGNYPMIFHFSGWQVEMWQEIFQCAQKDSDSVNNRVLKDAIRLQMITFDIPENEDLVELSAATTHALQFSFQQYKNWLSENPDWAQKQENILLNRLKLNNYKAFFVAFVLHFCGVKHIKNTDVPLLALSNSDEFAEVFGIQRDF